MLNRIGRTCISLLVEHCSFHAFYKKCGLQRDFMSCSSRLTLQRRWIFFLHFSVFWKSYKSEMLLGIMHAAPPLPKSPLISSYQQQSIWPKISVAYFTKWFQSVFTVGGSRMYPFNLPLLAPAYIPTQSCKRASFWSPNQARSHKPQPGSRPTFIFEARLRPESQIYRGS